MTKGIKGLCFCTMEVKYETHIDLRSLRKLNPRFILAMYLRLPAMVETIDSLFCRFVGGLAHLLGAFQCINSVQG
jgi:hypothetical protein